MADDQESAFGFHGTWREYAPIAFTNLLLTIVTLGFYRFWATTRTRQYLWSRTHFIDDRLEWTGKGMELFVGFLMVLLLFGAPFLFLQFGMQALIFQGHQAIALSLGMASGVFIFYLVGVARFRALRYRLSRTYWHGIRGGTDQRGWMYGLINMVITIAGYLPLGLLMPWSMMTMWDARWSAMSFGPFPFKWSGDWKRTMGRFLLFYLLPFILLIFGLVMAAMFAPAMQSDGAMEPPSAAVTLAVSFSVLGLYAFIGLIALAFYAKFFRVAVEGLSLSGLDFRFTARTKDWIKLILGDIGLVIFTLGIGYIFIAYRHWKFFITHMEASGEIDLAQLTQSTTREPGQGEGLLDAFDMGAI